MTPEAADRASAPGASSRERASAAAVEAIGVVRRHRTEARVSMGAPLARLVLATPPDERRRLER